MTSPIKHGEAIFPHSSINPLKQDANTKSAILTLALTIINASVNSNQTCGAEESKPSKEDLPEPDYGEIKPGCIIL